jgi:hypothetical protein
VSGGAIAAACPEAKQCAMLLQKRSGSQPLGCTTRHTPTSTLSPSATAPSSRCPSSPPSTSPRLLLLLVLPGMSCMLVGTATLPPDGLRGRQQRTKRGNGKDQN